MAAPLVPPLNLQRAVVVVPTYNEADNIGRLVPLIGWQLAAMLSRLAVSGLSRKDEFEADAYATALMLKAADICVRIRALPFGTTGKEKPMT